MTGQNLGMMPLRKNVGDSPPDDWELQNCPICGQECYYQGINGEVLKSIAPETVFVCTECALRGLAKKKER